MKVSHFEKQTQTIFSKIEELKCVFLDKDLNKFDFELFLDAFF